MEVVRMNLLKAISLLICYLTLCGYTVPPTLTVTLPVGGSAWYIDGGRTESGDGLSEDTAWNNIEAADGNVAAGDIIYIKGTFGDGSADIDWNQNGTAGSEIVFKPWAGFSAEIKDRFLCNGDYIIFDGGTNKQIVFNGEDLPNLYNFYVYGDYVILWRCIIKDCTLNVNPCWTATNISGAGGNYTRIYNCEITGSRSVGIYMQDGDGWQIRNNIIVNNKGAGIQVDRKSVV